MVHALIPRHSISTVALLAGLAVFVLAPPAMADSPVSGSSLKDGAVPGMADSSVSGSSLKDGTVPSVSRFQGNKAFAAWQKEHRWVRVGLRFHGYLPALDQHAALDVGAGVMIPVTTDLFMGLGVRAAFIGAWNPGSGCINRFDPGPNPECSSGQVGGVDYEWREPHPLDETGNVNTEVVDGRDGNAVPGEDFARHRRPSHVAQFALAIGGNYELTLPHIRFFQIFQPFVGGGVLLMWVHTYSDITADEFVLINNPDNNPYDPDNLDPWSKQGPDVGGEVYGGFHINPSKLFRFVVEFGYSNVDIPKASLQKATSGFEASHMPYRLSQFRFGGGFEFKF